MCGRYTLTDLGKLTDPRRFSLGIVPFGFKPRFNIAPTQDAPIILDASPETITMAHWGLIPHWATDAKIGYRMINARAETIAEKPTFRRLFQRQRCLVLADGFYEWQRLGNHKQPLRITFKCGAVFAFAGLWHTWDDPSAKQPKTTFTIITTSANRLLKPIHDRMPVILKETDEKLWLSGDLSERKALALLKHYPASDMQTEEVSPLVNSPRNDRPEVLRPIGRPILVLRRPQ